MSEYRRFVSYFYEYIDGKKQKNAGFAKVELRNGMWRILLRIAAEGSPGSPIQVYGFVRETGRLQGILLGEIRPVQQIAEEWAFRADVPIGGGKYGLGDLAGIWVEDSGGRRFITVWDDEGIDVEQFVAESSRELVYAEDGPDVKADIPGNPDASEAPENENDSSGETEIPGSENDSSGEMEIPGSESDSSGETEAPESEGEDSEEAEVLKSESDSPEEAEHTAAVEEQSTEAYGEEQAAVIEELFRKRAAFCPFDNSEIGNCVMILPCDIVRLQQENWSVGRSSFLQHGFYQYRHLLLGKDGEGNYMLGVPGIQNPQETYMARMFGYDRFRESIRPDGSRNFGYWCRELRHM